MISYKAYTKLLLKACKPRIRKGNSKKALKDILFLDLLFSHQGTLFNELWHLKLDLTPEEPVARAELISTIRQLSSSYVERLIETVTKKVDRVLLRASERTYPMKLSTRFYRRNQLPISKWNFELCLMAWVDELLYREAKRRKLIPIMPFLLKKEKRKVAAYDLVMKDLINSHYNNLSIVGNKVEASIYSKSTALWKKYFPKPRKNIAA